VADPTTVDLVRRLNAGDFRAREDADRRLRTLGSKAGPALRAALSGKPSAELKDRVEKLLAALDLARPLAGDDCGPPGPSRHWSSSAPPNLGGS
jgi:hypothetical protein